MAGSNLSISVKLDAFVLNPSVCDGDVHEAKIAPITQPNYTFLRFDQFELQNDVLPHADLHNATPPSHNSRMTDLGTGKTRESRQGVYLHWMLPRPYRGGSAATKSGTKSNLKGSLKSEGTPTSPTIPDHSTPDYPPVPNRWLVIRKLDLTAATVPANTSIEPVASWVIESDRIRYIDDPDMDDSVDLQVDVSPFLKASQGLNKDGISINDQAEIFIGYRAPTQDREGQKAWSENPNADHVDLTLLSSSNNLFPDYQPHNSNVFSFVDRFDYFDASGQRQGSLTKAKADYYVIGWHSKPDDDLLASVDTTREERLDTLLMKLNDQEPIPDNVSQWLRSKDRSRVLCHGAMYGVEWNVEWTKDTRPQHIPANDAAKSLADDLSIAVGTTPMDALLSYVESHHADELENDLYNLTDLLRAQDDSVDGRREASDELQSHNFGRFAGGTHFAPAIDPQRPATPPSNDDQAALMAMNESQLLLDNAARWSQQTQWGVFSLWWKYVTDIDHDSAGPNQQYHLDVKTLNTIRNSIVNNIVPSQNKAKAVAASKISPDLQSNIKQSVLQEFNQSRDPTFFIGGVKSGWPYDYLDKLRVRLDFQITGSTTPHPSDTSFGIQCLPSELRDTAEQLVREFIANIPASSTASSTPSANTDTTFAPLYHDQGDASKDELPTAPWRDRWECTQPWFPLFLEWEAEYFHIPFDDFLFEGHSARLDKSTRFRYAIDDKITFYDPASSGDTTKPQIIQDIRTLSGRVLILPQPAFSLKAQLEQLFSGTPQEILDKHHISGDEKGKLLAQATQLPFLSAPFEGFLNHLSTLAGGSHLKPNSRVPGASLQPIADAYATSKNVGIDYDEISFIEKESDLTPYGSLVQFAGNVYPAFKPATHGQFRITKLNIIDKFGQTACAIDPKPRATGTPPLYPCISSYFEPQMRGKEEDGWANVVSQPERQGVCEFMQMTPQINQPARLNSAFVIHDKRCKDNYAYWRPVAEWENPIWGWLVVNYVDYGVQFFLQDGSFYREVRLAAPNAPNPEVLPPKWVPFPPETTTSAQEQLDQLIAQFSDQTTGRAYLSDFIKMVNTAVGDATSAPSAYGTFLHSLIGRPLALVNTGWSLELAINARKTQSTKQEQKDLPQPKNLLPGTDPDKQYQFPIKLGDKDRAHDGLVAFFEAKQAPQPGDELDMANLYTDFAEGSTVLKPKKNPKLSAYWVDPTGFLSEDLNDPQKAAEAAVQHAQAHNQGLTVFGAILDPFVAMNAFSSILPVQSLTLPSWTWEAALKKMTAFFHFGPLLITDDVPKFDETHRLQRQYFLTPPDQDQTVKGSPIPLPSLATADWSWLQPYVDDKGQKEQYMALSIGKLDTRPKYEKGPYTAVEGFLQMKAPIQQTKQ
jgi:hypothetical protein